MELAKRLRGVISLNALLLAFMLLEIAMDLSSSGFLIVIILILLSSFGYLFYWVIKPMLDFDKALDQCLKNDMINEKDMDKFTNDISYMRKVKILAEKYSEQKIRENSVDLFDKQAELTALQSQINPHFLCNTLESIRGQAMLDDNIEIAKMVEALASFFRYSISRNSNFVTLRDELANIKNYMMIQRYRFNNRFSLEIFIDEEDEEAYDYLIPKLILQPVVENALFHGLEEILEGGRVIIEVIVTENNLILTVSDNGKGMDNKTLMELNERIKSSNHKIMTYQDNKSHNKGIALPNIHKRIQLLFGKEFGINIYSTLNQGTDVELTLPANYERSE